MKVWACNVCGSVEAFDEGVSHGYDAGDSEPCVHCLDGSSQVVHTDDTLKIEQGEVGPVVHFAGNNYVPLSKPASTRPGELVKVSVREADSTTINVEFLQRPASRGSEVWSFEG